MEKCDSQREIHSGRVLKLLSAIRQRSNFFSNFGLETLNLNLSAVPEYTLLNATSLLHMLLNLYDCCAWLFKRNIEMDVKSTSGCKGNAQELIDRFYRYRDLKKLLKKDLDVFREMFRQSPTSKSSDWHAFYEKMRQWRKYHKKELDEGIPAPHFPETLPSDWSPLSETEQMNFQESIHEIANCEVNARHKLIPYYAGMVDNPTSCQKTYHFWEQLLLCICYKIEEVHNLCRDYSKILEEEYKMMFIFLPQKARELDFVVRERQRESCISNAEFYRRMAKILCESKETRKNLGSAQRAYKRNHAKSQDFNTYITTSSQEKKHTPEQAYLCYLFRKISSTKETSKIEDWNGIISLLGEFSDDPQKEAKIEQLFDFFRSKKNFATDKNIGLESFYNYLLISGFFDELHSRLDRKKYISKIARLRWKRINIPEKLVRNILCLDDKSKNAFLADHNTWATVVPVKAKTKAMRHRHLKKRKEADSEE